MNAKDKKPNIIFLHGWTMNGSAFDQQIELLGDEFQCFAPDLPGHGSSAHLTASIDASGDFLRELINDKDLDDVLLVGWSMGAAIAWNYLRRFGSTKVAGLITVDMSPKIVNEGEWSLGLVGRTAETIAASTAHLRDDWAMSAKAVASGMFATEIGPDYCPAKEAAKTVASQDPENMHHMWVDLTKLDERKTIAKIDVPMLVCFGEKSRAYGEPVANWIVAQARDATKKGFALSGHAPHFEEPDEFAHTVADFAQQL